MSLFTAIAQHIASLGAALPSQNARLIRLHTPLGPDALVVERVQIDDAIGPLPLGQAVAANPAGQRLEVTALCGNAHLELKSLMGQPVLLQLQSGAGVGVFEPWHGHVTQAALLGSDGGLARYRLVVQPWLAFLEHRQDSFVFNGLSVVQIIESVFADYAGQGTLRPQWRWDLLDPSVYAQRSLCMQYQESDLAFVQRLMREEGLFCFWECTGASGSGPEAGSHTLVIADHNGALAANREPTVRFAQGGPTLNADALWRMREHSSLHPATFALASPDYRRVALREVQQTGQLGNTGAPELLSGLSLDDIPGAYAYETEDQGQRLLTRQAEALDALRFRIEAEGGWRAARAGTHVVVQDNPRLTTRDKSELLILRAQHSARNNLRADHKAAVDSLLGAIQSDKAGVAGALARSQPEIDAGKADSPWLHHCTVLLQPLMRAVRCVNVALDAGAYNTLPGHPVADPRIHPRPTVSGVQTAIVVGTGDPVQVDRDQRVRIQFHWQRGSASSHQLEHPSGEDNAPGTSAVGTWVRVATPIAGQNWGSVFTPRVGQEVLVSFLGGDIDRPIVMGSVYNGEGQRDAQGNQRPRGTGAATGNAPAWFAGGSGAHAHNAVLSGIKTQALPESGHTGGGGMGGYNQLVFDDTPAHQRIELSTTQAATRLQLGHLLQQNDNQRLGPRGHGLELASRAWGAVRAGSGLLISAHREAPSTQGGEQLNSREPLARLQAGQELLHTLAQSAQDHQAKTQTEPMVKGATEADTARQLPTEQGLWALQQSLKTTTTVGEASGAIGGGTGSATAWGRPDLVLAAPKGVVQTTPASGISSAGASTSVVAGQDINHLSAKNWALAAKDGIVLYSYGKASNGQKPSQQTGIQLHAASGSVVQQSQQGATRIAADQAVDVTSTHASVKAGSPSKVLLTAGGAGISISGGNITLTAPGNIYFKAAMKNLTGGAGAGDSVALKKAGKLAECPSATQSAAANGASAL